MTEISIPGHRRSALTWLTVLVMFAAVSYGMDAFAAAELLPGDYGGWQGYQVSASESGPEEGRSDQKDTGRYYLLEAGTLTLRVEDPPEVFLATCRKSALADWQCLAQLFLWGMFLSDDRYTAEGDYARRLMPEAEERELAGSYLSMAARHLERQFGSAANEEPAGGEPMAELDRALDSLDFYHHVDNVPPVARTELARCFLALWSSVPPSPMDRETFLFKLHAGEWLKEHFFVSRHTGLQWDRSQFEAALAFFREAFAYHQQPIPPGVGGADPPYLELRLVRGIANPAVAYSQRRDRKGLWPVQNLPLTDLEAMEVLVAEMAEQGIIDAQETEQHAAWIKRESLRLQATEVRYWIEQAERQGDRKALANGLVELSLLKRDMGRLNDAREHLARAVSLLKAIDAKDLWAAGSVDLVWYQLEFREWAEALGTVRRILPLLKSTRGFGESRRLKDAIKWEQVALSALGRESEAAASIKRHQADLEAQAPIFNATGEAVAGLDSLLDDAEKAERLEVLIARLEPSSFLAAALVNDLLGLLNAQGAMAKFAELARQARLPIRSWWGRAKEHEFLGVLLAIEKERGEFAAFLEVLADYETVGRAVAGENWRAPHEHVVARVYYAFGAYDQAMQALQAKKEREWDALIRDPLVLRDQVPDPRDEVLEARILLAVGDRQRAVEIIDRLTASALHWTSSGAVRIKQDAEVGRALLPEIAEIAAGLDLSPWALELLELELERTDPAEDLSAWVQATVRADELRLGLGQPPRASVEQLEDLVADIREFPELGPINAVRLEAHLAELKRWEDDLPAARRHLEDALGLANELGAVEEEIALHRSLGGIAEEADDPLRAAGHYAASAQLVGSISERIPEDSSKVGYREERARAIPQLALVHYRLHRERVGQGDDEAMLAAVELGKSRALTEGLDDRGVLTKRVDVPALRRALPANTALLEYYTPAPVSQEVFRFYLDEERFDVTKLELSAPEMEERIRSVLDSVTRDRDFNEERLRSEAAELARLLLPDFLLSDEPATRKHVYVVPTGSLYLFPIGLLVDRAGLYLDERETLSISYLPSAYFLLKDPGKEKLHRSTGAYINPALEREHHDLLAEAPQLRAQLESGLRQTGEAVLHWEERRTPSEFLAEAAELDNVLLYAHARFLPDRPMESYIRLADSPGESRKLTAAALARTSLRQGLLTLAACSTGQGEVRSGDEVLGLPRALLLAGVTRVVISLWDVDAISSLTLIAEFYRLLGEDYPAAEALRSARSHLRRAGHPPFDWAPFILVGPH